jgi:hypothetical protein
MKGLVSSQQIRDAYLHISQSKARLTPVEYLGQSDSSILRVSQSQATNPARVLSANQSKPPPRISTQAFAHPSSELTLIEGVGKSFSKKGLIPIVSQVEMSELMRAEFQAQCGDEFESLKFEILSMLDSEICAIAPVFYYSIMSSYSMNIQQERIVRTRVRNRLGGLASKASLG